MALRKFVDKLPIPKILCPKYKGYGWAYYKVRMKQFTKKLHSDFPGEATLWGYESSYPGQRLRLVGVKM